jgi:spore germination cell wall hydrolase CwlJ-like protein
MFRFARAAAYAVAALTVAFTATYSRPSLAWEIQAAPPATAYLDHAVASPGLSLGDDAPEAVASEPSDAGLAQDVAEHSAAQLTDARPEPEAGESRSLGELVRAYSDDDVPDREHECLAGAVYFESKGEPLQGQLAVAEVILNRAASGKFPTTICGVVTQKSQFSFIRGGKFPPIARGSEAWRKAVAIAHIAKKDLAEGGIGKAMFFHARYVSPRWRLTRVASIGNHIFYR